MGRHRRYRTVWGAVIGGESTKAFGPRRTKWSLLRVNSKWRNNPKKKRSLRSPRDGRDTLWLPERMVPRRQFYRHYNTKGRAYTPITIRGISSLPFVIDRINLQRTLPFPLGWIKA